MPTILCSKCQNLIPPTLIINGKRRSMNKRKYCVACSPFGSRNTRKLDGTPRKVPKNKIYQQKFSEFLPQAKELHNKGYSIRMIAKELKLCKATINSWVKKGWLPHRTHAEAMRIASNQGRMRGPEDWSEESRSKLRTHMLRRIAENPMNHPNRKLANNRKKMSFPEKLVFDILTEAQINFQHNQKIDRYYPDFTIEKIIIEVDGARWHNIEKDKIRDEFLSKLGFFVKRFSSKEIIKNPKIVLNFLSEYRP